MLTQITPHQTQVSWDSRTAVPSEEVGVFLGAIWGKSRVGVGGKGPSWSTQEPPPIFHICQDLPFTPKFQSECSISGVASQSLLHPEAHPNPNPAYGSFLWTPNWHRHRPAGDSQGANPKAPTTL